MAMQGTLKSRNGKLYVLYTYDEFSEPFRQYIWYRVLQSRGNGYGDRPEDGDIATSSSVGSGGEWQTHNPSTHRSTGSVSTGTGSTKAESVERVSLNPPSTGGKQLRWHDGRWEKLMARGWVPAGEGGKTKSKKTSAGHATVRASYSAPRAHSTRSPLPTKATLRALDAISVPDPWNPVSPTTRARLVREGYITADGKLTDRGEDALNQRLVHEVLGRDHATKKKSASQLEREIAEALASRKVPHDASYGSVHRLAVQENRHRELAEQLEQIEQATHVAERPELVWRASGKHRRVAKKGDYVAYGTRAEVEERVGPDQRYGIVRPITNKDRQKLIADRRRVFARY